MGFPIIGREEKQATVNKARIEKERLDNERFAEFGIADSKYYFVPEHDKRQVNALSLSRNPIPPKRRAPRLPHIAPQPQTLPPPRPPRTSGVSTMCRVVVPTSLKKLKKKTRRKYRF
jgi:hypothetical protein